MSDLVERVAARIGDILHACGKFPNPSGDPWTDGPSILAAHTAIDEVLDTVARHLSAVQYDPAPYTAMKARLEGLRREGEG